MLNVPASFPHGEVRLMSSQMSICETLFTDTPAKHKLYLNNDWASPKMEGHILTLLSVHGGVHMSTFC